MSTGPEIVRSRLAVGFRLDSLWAETMGIDPSDTKERPLRLVALMEEYPDVRTPETLARLREVRLSLQALDEA